MCGWFKMKNKPNLVKTFDILEKSYYYYDTEEDYQEMLREKSYWTNIEGTSKGRVKCIGIITQHGNGVISLVVRLEILSYKGIGKILRKEKL